MLNIFHNFILNKNIICNDKDPPWFNNQIKTLIEKKNHLFKSYMANCRLAVDRVSLQKAGAELINIIKSSKENFYNNLGKTLNDPNTSSKTYWSIMKTFVNGKKTSIIPHLLVDNYLISNFGEKSNIFNDFSVQQCQPIANNIIFPTNQVFYTQNRLRDFDIDCGKISKLMNGLSPHKAHGHDGISIRMVKLHNLTITKSLSIMYKNCLQQGVFLDEWKKGDIIPVHKKNSKQIVDNYRPVSLLTFCFKILEKLIFDSIYEFLNKNNLFNNN